MQELRWRLFLRGLVDIHMRKPYFRTRSRVEGEGLIPDVFHAHFGMCLPGSQRLMVTVDGDLLPCERVPSQAPAFNIGNLEDGFDFDAITNLTDGNAALCQDECVTCWNISTCEIPCARIIGPDGKLSREAKLENCATAKRVMHDSLVLMTEILERNPQALSFLK